MKSGNERLHFVAEMLDTHPWGTFKADDSMTHSVIPTVVKQRGGKSAEASEVKHSEGAWSVLGHATSSATSPHPRNILCATCDFLSLSPPVVHWTSASGQRHQTTLESHRQRQALGSSLKHGAPHGFFSSMRGTIEA